MARRIEGFEAHRRRARKARRHRVSDGSVERVHDTASRALRDWQTDAYRGQSGRREADVHG